MLIIFKTKSETWYISRRASSNNECNCSRLFAAQGVRRGWWRRREPSASRVDGLLIKEYHIGV